MNTLIKKILILVAILGVFLWAILVDPDDYFPDKNKTVKIKLNKTIEMIRLYKKDVGKFPDSSNLAALLKKNHTPNWGGPYLSKADLVDPWNSKVIYKNTISYVSLISVGLDQKESTADDIELKINKSNPNILILISEGGVREYPAFSNNKL